ncbi:MAG TPA: CDP-alcohol phosphatidyltransferase family protein [Candidatus Methylomirabilis sp.]|nr:CDP-alcohol phosphatidyltransferase family protein [Candidatus Methylomirabilis sp.]
MAFFFDEAVRRPIDACIPLWIKPNHLSLGRVVLIAPLIYWRDHPIVAVSTVIASGLLDLFDGPLARIRGQVSRLGAFIDAIADKAFVWSALIFSCRGAFPPWLIWSVIVADLALIAIRPVKLALNRSVNASALSKVKFWLQMIALGMALTRSGSLEAPAIGMLFGAFFCAIVSLFMHVRDLGRTPS